jgi:hypothetical protein
MALASFGNILDIFAQRFSLAALRYSKALPIITFFVVTNLKNLLRLFQKTFVYEQLFPLPD